jgi:hypothetical protein
MGARHEPPFLLLVALTIKGSVDAIELTPAAEFRRDSNLFVVEHDPDRRRRARQSAY